MDPGQHGLEPEAKVCSPTESTNCLKSPGLKRAAGPAQVFWCRNRATAALAPTRATSTPATQHRRGGRIGTWLSRCERFASDWVVLAGG